MRKCLKSMKCRICGYVYEPAVGDKRYFIKPNTPFELLPDNWKCPVCKYPKSAFYTVKKWIEKEEKKES